jgi:hypothetical protein
MIGKLKAFDKRKRVSYYFRIARHTPKMLPQTVRLPSSRKRTSGELQLLRWGRNLVKTEHSVN